MVWWTTDDVQRTYQFLQQKVNLGSTVAKTGLTFSIPFIIARRLLTDSRTDIYWDKSGRRGCQCSRSYRGEWPATAGNERWCDCRTERLEVVQNVVLSGISTTQRWRLLLPLLTDPQTALDWSVAGHYWSLNGHWSPSSVHFTISASSLSPLSDSFARLPVLQPYQPVRLFDLLWLASVVVYLRFLYFASSPY